MFLQKTKSFPIIANRIVPKEIWAKTKEELKEGNA